MVIKYCFKDILKYEMIILSVENFIIIYCQTGNRFIPTLHPSIAPFDSTLCHNRADQHWYLAPHPYYIHYPIQLLEILNLYQHYHQH